MSRLYCGFSQIEITPDPKSGVYIDGYGRRLTPAEGVRDPLYVKTCAIKSEDNLFVIAVFDICGFNEELKRKIRTAIRDSLKLEDHQFAVCATHTHAGPACGVLKHLPVNWIYWHRVCMKAVEAVKQAMDSAVAGTFKTAWGKELTLPFNRRGKEIIDRRVKVCGFYDDHNKMKGVITTANCHPVCITDMYMSADYPAIMTARAAKEYPGIPFLFLQGRGADIDPNFPDRDRVAMQPRLGKELADSVFGALEKVKEDGFAAGKIKSLYRTVQVPVQYQAKEVLIEEKERRMELLAQTDSEVTKTEALLEYFWLNRSLDDLEAGKIHSVNADLQIMIVNNNFSFVFVPFEMLTQTGNALEKMMLQKGIDPEYCFVFGYSNGTNGYLIPSTECTIDDYETCAAAYCYDLPGVYCPESERTVLQAYEEMADILLRS